MKRNPKRGRPGGGLKKAGEKQKKVGGGGGMRPRGRSVPTEQKKEKKTTGRPQAGSKNWQMVPLGEGKGTSKRGGEKAGKKGKEVGSPTKSQVLNFTGTRKTDLGGGKKKKKKLPKQKGGGKRTDEKRQGGGTLGASSRVQQGDFFKRGAGGGGVVKKKGLPRGKKNL